MATLMEDFEQQYAILSAEITTNISSLSAAGDGEKHKNIRGIERLLEEVNELLEQMELEVQSMAPELKSKYANRVRSYQAELKRLKREYLDARSTSRVDLYISRDSNDFPTDDKAQLLDNTDRLERATRQLKAGRQVAIETEQVGAEILSELGHQREVITRARERIRDTNDDVTRSSQLLTSMIRKAFQSKVAVQLAVGIVVFGFVLAIVLSIRNHF
ncbi:vesicle transport through interaction with t-SNAREs homolog 1A-like [Varroa jacobsoni]|uniref:Vesicle transport through interaction with t-SNAREs homolog 1A n=1 Tax=Varroa destructor TaxID=109461 RepID=A0A7M7J6W1_VARDE|nr:vesicle transport through interaction with t-SNAREs homolog 1A-like [Varroa destructor]XP_022700819.1 vesicle transport through interaction with t-SNAREs homolog 1A-like [Varroa jacobsoni]